MAHTLIGRYVNGGAMRILSAILVFLTVMGSSYVFSQDGQNKNDPTIEQHSRLVEWMQNTHNKIQRQLLILEEFSGQKVKYQVNIDVFGNVVDIKLLETSGNGSLESYAKSAIFRAHPFDLSQLDENDFVRVQVFNVAFAPK
ncbi:energy transducer TonB [Vibrio harveyi]|uniref:energy transducer TonB n=1 Tax=Vibrio harveyi TaxID=669 RepID=UPI0018F18D41|nr:cell envelope integrity protein TolA [Vibrio harveyi]